jgi:hypothetical protein
MPNQPSLRDKLMVPVEIPTWGVITFIVSGAFAFGALYRDLQTVVKNQDKVELIYERQIRNIEAVANAKETLRAHDVRLENHEARIGKLEGAVLRR